MQRFVEVYVFLGFLVIGISHITMAASWNEFFALLRSKGRAGVIANGMLALTVGSIVVAGHNVWAGLPIIVTLVGWAQLIKGVLHLTIPGIGERSLQMAETNALTKFRLGGAVMLIVDIPIGYLLFTPT